MLIAEYGEVRLEKCSAALSRLASRALVNKAPIPRILLLDTDTPLALSPAPGLLVLSKGMLLLLPSEAEVFFIIAHELGHSELGHHSGSKSSGSIQPSSFKRELELSADAYALERLLSAGYPVTAAFTALQRAYGEALTTSPQHGPPSDYPSVNERIQSLMQHSVALLAAQREAPVGAFEHRDFQECRGELRSGVHSELPH